MLTPRCETCGDDAPTVFATYRLRRQDIKIALCDVCSREDTPTELLRRKAGQLPVDTESEFQPAGTVYIVVEVRSRDDYFAHQPGMRPIAVFLNEAHAGAFIANKKSEGYIDVDWDIVDTPFIELPHHGTQQA